MATKDKALTYYEAIGRRRSAVARVRLYIQKAKTLTVNSEVKKGEIMVNDLPIDTYFPLDTDKIVYLKPLELADAVGRFAISIVVRGGGKHGQLEATAMGLARALELVDGSLRAKLKPEGLLTRDSRTRERRKPGTGGRARRQKQSPKR
jgi:small subunit ribosomal protein S9